MSSPAADSKPAAAPVVEEPAHPANARRPGGAPWRVLKAALAVALITLGGLLLAANLGLLAPAAQHVLDLAWPAALILAGLGIILAGDRLWAAEMTPFAVERADAEEASLTAAAGTADLRVEALADAVAELAAGELPWPTGPRVERADHSATLRLEPPWGRLALSGARWAVALGEGLPWRLDLRSSTGTLDLDLRGVALAGLRLRSGFGDVTLTLPAAGSADLDLGLAFGDLAVTVPDGLGVKVKIRKGALAEVEHDERRFISLGPNELGTPLYAVSTKRCTLAVWLGTGNLRLK